MLSLQAWVVKFFCRLFVKRALMKPSKAPIDGIRRMRRRLSRYDLFNASFKRGLRVERVMGPVRGEWLLPRGAPRDRAVLYVHGGAFVACSPLTHRRLTTALAKESGVPVFAVKYRLAPEARFPAALDDAVAAYDALRARGIAAERIVIAGDSAGGGLALAAVLALLQRPHPERLGGALAFSPWTDLLGTGDSIRTNAASDDMLPGTGIIESAANYAPTDAIRRDPLASPLYGDLRDFPRALVFASTTEVLRDDGVRFVERARAAGATAEIVLQRGMPHVWPIFYDVMPEARRTVRRASAFVREAVGATASGSSAARASSAR